MTINALWSAGIAGREDFLRLAREAASLTLPHLSPDLSPADKGRPLERPFQSTGAAGVNNLAAKLSIGLFPPQAPYFKYDIDYDFLIATGVLTVEQVGLLQLFLSKRERSIQRFMDTAGARPRTFEALMNLIVTGNYCLRYDADGRLRGFRIDQFQVKRDAADRVMHVITREVADRLSLPPQFQKNAAGTDLVGHDPDDLVDLYTIAERVLGDENNLMWTTWQEDREGMVISPDGEEKVKDIDMPLIPLRMIPDSNEDYGRSWVELHYSDLKGHEGLNQAILEAAALSSHIVRVIDPGAGITPAELHKARNGQALIGKGDLITTLHLDKLADISIAGNVNSVLRDRIDQSFVKLSPRDAERVTAEEIRATIRELNEALGGVLGSFATEFQLPLVQKLEAIMERKKLLDDLPFEVPGTSEIKVVTGIDAIGRGRDEIQLNSFLGTAQQTLGPETVARWVNAGEYFKRLAASQGLDPEGLIRTEEQVQQQIQQEQQAALAQAAAGPAIKAGADAAQQ